MMINKRVAVGMSGGVDSSVAVALLKEQGYEVTGVYIEAYNAPGCRSDQDREDALAVVARLNLRFKVLDLRKEYQERVIKYFLDEYRVGRTPNPDVVCNREIKFGLFYDWAMKHNYDYVATGHYARILYKVSPCKIQGETWGRAYLQRPKDLTKDQSYFLWQIPQDHLKNILFPLGDMLKSEVRAKARELGLPNANKPDSMGVCMMGELDVGEFLRNKLGEKPGEVVMQCHGDTVTQCHIGTHRGLWFYTIGQRGGWEQRLNHYTIKLLNHLGTDTNNLSPLYVIGKDKEKNRLIVGTRGECYRDKFQIINSQIFKSNHDLWVRIRNLGELVPVTRIGGGVVTLQKPIFAPAEGQSAVFYNQDGVVVGGGIIG